MLSAVDLKVSVDFTLCTTEAYLFGVHLLLFIAFSSRWRGEVGEGVLENR